MTPRFHGLLAVSGIAIAAAAFADSSLVIKAPSSDTSLTPGQSFWVTVFGSGTEFPTGIAVTATTPLGASEISYFVHSLVTLRMTVPLRTPPGRYQLTAMGLNADNKLSSSDPVQIAVERNDQPIALRLSDYLFLTLHVGEEREVVVIAEFPNGDAIDVSHSSRLKLRSYNPSVAAGRGGKIVAASTGKTTLYVTYASMTYTLSVTVE